MNDDRSPIDDELLSAVLDGEATPEERALVEASPEGRARLEQLRATAARLAEPVTPLAADVSARLLARAHDEAPPATTEGGERSPATGATPDPPTLPLSPGRRDELAGRRQRRRSWAGALAGVAAAVLVVVVGVSLARGGSRDSASDSSSGASASATANGSADAAAPTGESSTALATSLAELGALPDTATVLARFAVLEAAGADFDHQFDPSAPGSGTNERNQSTADGAARVPSPAACPVPPIAPTAGESWAAAAAAQLPSGPVIVMVDRAGGTGARVLVVDAATCAVLAEGTT
jgi:hypothetical protein